MINPFVILNKRIDFPENYLVIMPENERFRNFFTDQFADPNNCRFYKNTVIECPDDLLTNVRAVKFGNNDDQTKATFSFPFLPEKIQLPVGNRPKITFDNKSNDSIPLPSKHIGKIVIGAAFSNTPVIKVSSAGDYNIPFLTYSSRKNRGTNENIILISIYNSKPETTFDILQIKLHDFDTKRFIPQITSANKKGTEKSWELAVCKDELPGVLWGEKITDSTAVSISKVELLLNPSKDNIIPGYYQEGYELKPVAPQKIPIKDLTNKPYTSLVEELGFGEDEYSLLQPGTIMTENGFFKKLDGMPLGVGNQHGKLKLRRMAKNDFFYSDMLGSVLFGNLLIQKK